MAAAAAFSLSCAGAGAEADEEIMRMIPDDALIFVSCKNMSGALSEYLNSPDTKKRISEMLEKAGKGIAIYNKYVESGEKEAAENVPTLEKITLFKELLLSVLEPLDSLGGAAFYADGKPLAVFWTDAESLEKILGRLKGMEEKLKAFGDGGLPEGMNSILGRLKAGETVEFEFKRKWSARMRGETVFAFPSAEQCGEFFKEGRMDASKDFGQNALVKKYSLKNPNVLFYTGGIGEIQRFSPIAGAYVRTFLNLLGDIARSDAESAISPFSAMNSPILFSYAGIGDGRAREAIAAKKNIIPIRRKGGSAAWLDSVQGALCNSTIKFTPNSGNAIFYNGDEIDLFVSKLALDMAPKASDNLKFNSALNIEESGAENFKIDLEVGGAKVLSHNSQNFDEAMSAMKKAARAFEEKRNLAKDPYAVSSIALSMKFAPEIIASADYFRSEYEKKHSAKAVFFKSEKSAGDFAKSFQALYAAAEASEYAAKGSGMEIKIRASNPKTVLAADCAECLKRLESGLDAGPSPSGLESFRRAREALSPEAEQFQVDLADSPAGGEIPEASYEKGKTDFNLAMGLKAGTGTGFFRENIVENGAVVQRGILKPELNFLIYITNDFPKDSKAENAAPDSPEAGK